MIKVAIVDDVKANAMLLEGYIKALPNIEAVSFTSPVLALAWCRENG